MLGPIFEVFRLMIMRIILLLSQSCLASDLPHVFVTNVRRGAAERGIVDIRL